MKSQSGNALFLILIAVALFAALSYAVTNSGRGGGGIDKEQASIYAAEIVQYANLIQTTVRRLKVINGCSDNEISFWKDSSGNGVEDGGDVYYNSNAPIDRSCHIFQPGEGSLPVPSPNVDIFDTTYAATAPPSIYLENYKFDPATCVYYVGNATDCGSYTSASSGDFLLKLSFISEEICLAINSQLDLDNPPYANGTINDTGFNGYWKGTFYSSHAMRGSSVNKPVYHGCVRFRHATGSPYSFMYFMVILPNST